METHYIPVHEGLYLKFDLLGILLSSLDLLGIFDCFITKDMACPSTDFDAEVRDFYHQANKGVF